MSGRKTTETPRLLDDAKVERQMEMKRAEIQTYRQSRSEISERRERDRKLRNTLKALQFRLYEQMQVCTHPFNGPLSYDLATHCGLDKFVDDTTLSELLPPSASVSNMPLYFESILTWTVNNDMQINILKTKEIILGRISQENLELLSTPAGTVEGVTP